MGIYYKVVTKVGHNSSNAVMPCNYTLDSPGESLRYIKQYPKGEKVWADKDSVGLLAFLTRWSAEKFVDKHPMTGQLEIITVRGKKRRRKVKGICHSCRLDEIARFNKVMYHGYVQTKFENPVEASPPPSHTVFLEWACARE